MLMDGRVVVIDHRGLGRSRALSGAMPLDDQRGALRRSFAARVPGASLGGLPTPRFEALVAEACAGGLSEADFASAFAGSLKRVRTGQGDEADTCNDWVALGALR